MPWLASFRTLSYYVSSSLAYRIIRIIHFGQSGFRFWFLVSGLISEMIEWILLISR